ncbi:hypothetical protein F7661_01910 [Pseudomonas sp. CFA]|nr:hypothetical protein F7661_01910 [Pseudomonas sp. CFA]
MLCIGRSPFPNVEHFYPVSQVSLKEDRRERAGECGWHRKKGVRGMDFVVADTGQAGDAVVLGIAIYVGVGSAANIREAGAMHRANCFAGKPAPAGPRCMQKPRSNAIFCCPVGSCPAPWPRCCGLRCCVLPGLAGSCS